MCFCGSTLQLPGPCFNRDLGRILQHILCMVLWKCSANPLSQPTVLACLARLIFWQLSVQFHVFLPSMEVISSPANCRGDIMSTSQGSWSSPDTGGNGLHTIQTYSQWKERFRVKSWLGACTGFLQFFFHSPKSGPNWVMRLEGCEWMMCALWH